MKSYTLAKARTEIETARNNREASAGLFIFSQKAVPEGMDTLMRLGDDVFVVWDSDRVESDVILRAGFSLAKALCVKKARKNSAEIGNLDHIDKAVLALEQEAERLSKMKS